MLTSGARRGSGKKRCTAARVGLQEPWCRLGTGMNSGSSAPMPARRSSHLGGSRRAAAAASSVMTRKARRRRCRGRGRCSQRERGAGEVLRVMGKTARALLLQCRRLAGAARAKNSRYFRILSRCRGGPGRRRRACVAAAQEERFTRRRHDERFPAQAARWCLESAGLALADLDAVVFYDKPFLKFERLLETYLACAPRGLRSFVAAMPVWIKEKLFLKAELRRELRCARGRRRGGCRSCSSASITCRTPRRRSTRARSSAPPCCASTASASGPRPRPGSASGTRLEPRWELHFPHSLGLLYSAFTAYTGFKVNSGEYKMMGLAPYGEPRYADLIRRHLVDVKPDGTFRLDMRYFGYATGLRMTTERFHALFGGPPRTPGRAGRPAHHGPRGLDPAGHRRHRAEARAHAAARDRRAAACASRAASRSTASRTDCWCARACSTISGSSPPRATPAAHSARRCSPGTSAGGARSPAGRRSGDAHVGRLPRARLVRTRRSKRSAASTACRTSGSSRRRWSSGSRRAWPRAPSSAGCRGGWSSGRARSATARSSPTRATRPCSATLNLKIKFRESFRPFAPAVLREQVGRALRTRPAEPVHAAGGAGAAVRRRPCRRGGADPQGWSGCGPCGRPCRQSPTSTAAPAIQTVDQQHEPAFFTT